MPREPQLVKVVLTANLQKYYPNREFQIEAGTILELLQKMDEVRPQFSSYILEDDLTVRKHVNLFLNNCVLAKNKIRTELKSGDTLHIMQALSGG